MAGLNQFLKFSLKCILVGALALTVACVPKIRQALPALSGDSTTIPAAPTITSINHAAALPGAVLVLTGTGLSNVTTMSVNGTPVVTFTVDSATSITFTVPAGATTGNVVVTTSDAETATSPSPLQILSGSVATLSINGSVNYGKMIVGDSRNFTFSVENDGGTLAQEITVVDTSEGAFSITGLVFPGGSGGSFCGSTLAASGACDVQITVAPDRTGFQGSQLAIQFYDGLQMQTFQIGAQIQAIELDRTHDDSRITLDFGAVPVGSNEYRVVVLQNRSDYSVPLTVTLIGPVGFAGGAYPGTSSDFVFPSSAPSCGANLASNSRCSLLLAYSPTGAPSAFLPTLEIGVGTALSTVTITASFISAESCTCNPADSATFGGGNGGVFSPYTICSRAHLERMHTDFISQNGYPGIYFRQCADIDLGGSATPFSPIGDFSVTSLNFQGIYDGNFYAIRNLYHTTNKDDKGLFSRVNSAEIKNVRLFNFEITNGVRLGGLAGRIEGDTLLTNNLLVGSLSATSDAGGLMGRGSLGTSSRIDSNFFIGTVIVSGAQYAGGFGGLVQSPRVVNSGAVADVSGPGLNNIGGIFGASGGMSGEGVFFAGSVSGANNVGGQVGNIDTHSISVVTTLAEISGATQVGGFAGAAAAGTLFRGAQVLLTGLTSSGGTRVGGLFGISDDSAIGAVRVEGTISGGSRMGGLVGQTSAIIPIESGSFVGSISGVRDLGGLVGLGSAAIIDSYVQGSVIGTADDVGGIVGRTTAVGSTFSRVYSALIAGSAASNFHPIATEVGTNISLGDNCGYWNSGVANGVSPVGGTYPSVSRLLPASAEEMVDPTFPLYSAWDFAGFWTFATGGLGFPVPQ